MKYNIKLIITSLIIMLSFCPAIHAAPDVTVKKNSVAHRDGSLTVKGNLPRVEGSSNAIFMSRLNQSITKLYDAAVANAKTNKFKSIAFDYEAIYSGSIVSIVLHRSETSTSTTQNYTHTFVFNKNTNKYVQIADILGSNGIKICNKVIADTIKGDERYYDFKGIDENHSFYVSNGNVIVIFDEGMISAVSRGHQKFEIPYANIKNTIIGKDDYYTKTAYNIKMIPLRKIVTAFDYKISFNKANQMVEITKDDFSSALTIGKNGYKKGRLSNIQLELSPEIIDGTTYVPISFFEEIMDIYFTVDANGYITFSSYTPKAD